MTVSKRNLLFQNAIFRFHVKLWEGNPRSKKQKRAVRFRYFFHPLPHEILTARHDRRELWLLEEPEIEVLHGGIQILFLFCRFFKSVGFFSFFQVSSLPFYHGKLDLFVCLGDFFADSNMVSHHSTTIWDNIFWNFSKHRRCKIQACRSTVFEKFENVIWAMKRTWLFMGIQDYNKKIIRIKSLNNQM